MKSTAADSGKPKRIVFEQVKYMYVFNFLSLHVLFVFIAHLPNLLNGDSMTFLISILLSDPMKLFVCYFWWKMSDQIEGSLPYIEPQAYKDYNVNHRQQNATEQWEYATSLQPSHPSFQHILRERSSIMAQKRSFFLYLASRLAEKLKRYPQMPIDLNKSLHMKKMIESRRNHWRK